MRWAPLVCALVLLSPRADAKPSPCDVPEGLDPTRVSASLEPSKGLGEELCVIIAKPDKGQEAQLVIIALHGLGAGPDQWLTSGALIERLDRLTRAGELPPTAVVAPEGRGGYWTDWSSGEAPWGSWVARELIEDVLPRHGLKMPAPQRALIGLSMGGFGALSLGLRNPETFGILGALSPTDMELATKAQPNRTTYTNVFGRPIDKRRVRALNPRRLVEAGSGKGQLVLVAWGDREPKKFSVGARHLRRALKRARVASDFRTVKGGTHGFGTTWSPSTIDWMLKRVAGRVTKGAEDPR